MADDDSEWRFSLEDLTDGDAAEDGKDGDAEGGEADDEGPLGRPDPPIEPARPGAENVAFFALGAAIAIAVFWLLLFG